MEMKTTMAGQKKTMAGQAELETTTAELKQVKNGFCGHNRKLGGFIDGLHDHVNADREFRNDLRSHVRTDVRFKADLQGRVRANRWFKVASLAVTGQAKMAAAMTGS